MSLKPASVLRILFLFFILSASSSALVASLIGNQSDHDRGQRPARPVAAVEAMLRAFDQKPLVVIGEAHGLLQQHEFFQQLLRHPEFPAKVDDIVVEFGNALYQPVLDRYVEGDEVPLSELQLVWRDHSASPMQPWDAPIYQAFFDTIREVNRLLPANERLRVIAADPPIDWQAIATRDEVFDWRMQRDAHMASVTIRDVLSRGRRALFVAGTSHVVRRSGNSPGAPQARNAVQLIEEQFPSSTFVIAPHTGFGAQTASLELRLSWPRPSIAPVAGTWVGELPAKSLFPDLILVGPPGSEPPDIWVGLTIDDLIDAYLFLGPRESLVLTVPSPVLMRDDSYFAELNRRSVIVRGRPLPVAPQFYSYGFPTPPPPSPLP